MQESLYIETRIHHPPNQSTMTTSAQETELEKYVESVMRGKDSIEVLHEELFSGKTVRGERPFRQQIRINVENLVKARQLQDIPLITKLLASGTKDLTDPKSCETSEPEMLKKIQTEVLRHQQSIDDGKSLKKIMEELWKENATLCEEIDFFSKDGHFTSVETGEVYTFFTIDPECLQRLLREDDVTFTKIDAELMRISNERKEAVNKIAH